ncbi:GNAT family N-acetyltransferase [Hoeflea prorocentri]|uniref:GNAT family N-acetyltransferase n=1 Tax=Hoeflea prorocentri TaxID=1922333 RepID=A0A9X3UMV7_9HYPH|nr:GNAT family N-acetyltransferase [Hoeflea prorocentri]MCY6383471.1 GNAT family N-acetyltransferase [Hoeflea prorocentri]MDA5401271.1 GNAT family N-acetyltransferase [Hoeflea prorocentri]
MVVQSPGDMDYQWEIVDSENGLGLLEREWSALNARCGPQGFFTRYEVIRANWDRHRADSGSKLHIVVFRDRGGTLVMGVPMVRVREPLGTHKLVWLDSKTPLYDDVLLDPDVEIEVAARHFKSVLSTSLLNRVLKIGFVLEGSNLHRLLNATGLPTKLLTTAPSLNISEFESWEHYLSRISTNRRQRIRNFVRRIEKAGAKAPRLITNAAERRDVMNELFDRKRRWAGMRSDLMDWVAPEETEAWFQLISNIQDERNRSHLFLLESDTERIASLLFFERDGTLFLSKLAHSEAWEQFSPGWLIVHEAIKFGIEQRMKTVDFMIGNGAWKERIADRTNKIFGCRAGPVSWRFGTLK